jgi:hypothetical protein
MQPYTMHLISALPSALCLARTCRCTSASKPKGFCVQPSYGHLARLLCIRLVCLLSIVSRYLATKEGFAYFRSQRRRNPSWQREQTKSNSLDSVNEPVTGEHDAFSERLVAGVPTLLTGIWWGDVNGVEVVDEMMSWTTIQFGTLSRAGKSLLDSE